jgi:hypothetical protein
MTPEELAALKALAEKATPGPWDACGTGAYVAMMQIINDRITKYVSAPQAGMCMSDADVQYIAAANPQTVLKLIAEVSRRRAQIAKIRAAFFEHGLEKVMYDD